MDDATKEPEPYAVETAAPATHAETGVALHGDYPLNGRLRAEALADAGKEEDPDGLVSAELIADAKERLALERVDAQANTPSMSWARNKLVEHATAAGVAFETDDNKATILAKINAAPAASTEA